jgi:proline racemase
LRQSRAAADAGAGLIIMESTDHPPMSGSNTICTVAAQSLRTDATLVTANISEFQRVKGLSWQDWAGSRA